MEEEGKAKRTMLRRGLRESDGLLVVEERGVEKQLVVEGGVGVLRSDQIRMSKAISDAPWRLRPLKRGWTTREGRLTARCIEPLHPETMHLLP
jgi:hypothetical protein